MECHYRMSEFQWVSVYYASDFLNSNVCLIGFFIVVIVQNVNSLDIVVVEL